MAGSKDDETITITGGGGISQTVTRAELDRESEAMLKKRNKKKTPSRFRVAPTSTDVGKSSVQKLIERVTKIK